MRYFLEIAYNGTQYFGWQRQPKDISVQEVIETALSTLIGTSTAIVGAGRTDTGVHAKRIFAHFDADSLGDLEHLMYRLNSFLPKDIAIKRVFPVTAEAHARFDAMEREYEYYINLKKDPFLEGFALITHRIPDVDLMNKAAEILLEYDDFQCFSRSKTDVKTYHCKIKRADWERRGDLLVFTISADRFLRNMVRAIVGTLLEIGYEKRSVQDLHEIIKSKNRNNAGASAPAHGLYLTRVMYPETIKIKQ